MPKSLRHIISFKNTTRDVKLYNDINTQEEKSDFVKNAVEFYLKYRDMEHHLIEILRNQEKQQSK